MSGPKRTRAEREADRAEIARLYLQRKTQVEIARRLKISQQQVAYDLKIIERRWRESGVMDLNEAKARELAEIDTLEREYWDAWERSCRAKETSSTEKVEGQKDETGETRLKAGLLKEQRDGNPAFLVGVQWCIERRCKMLRLDAPIQIEHSGPDGQPLPAAPATVVVYLPDNGRNDRDPAPGGPADDLSSNTS